jgi:hypothetical protein
MESSPRTPAGARRLRPLNAPAAIQLRTKAGVPWAVLQRARWRRVEHVEDKWRVDDGWWRPSSVARTYFRIALEDGQLLTVYRDDHEGTWWAQRY